MKKAWIRLAASVVLSALLVVGISASGILTNGHRTDGLFYQASGIRPDAELLTVNGETIDAEEYLYWLAYDCEYLAYNVQDLDFDAELSEGMTYGAYAKQDGADRIELYTEPYAAAYSTDREVAVRPFVETAAHSRKLGLGVNAGHDLSLQNLAYFHHALPCLDEVSIGHALISDALYLGIEETIRQYLLCIKNKI